MFSFLHMGVILQCPHTFGHMVWPCLRKSTEAAVDLQFKTETTILSVMEQDEPKWSHFKTAQK